MRNAHHVVAFFLLPLGSANDRQAKRHPLRSLSSWRLPFVSGGLLLFVCAQMYSALAADIPGPVSHAQPFGMAIVFYAQPQVSEAMWTALSETLHADLADEAGEQPNPLVLDKQPLLVRGSEDLRGVVFSKVITVKLLGECNVFPQTGSPALHGPLGWVMMFSGEVQPYVSIDCTRLAQVLRPRLLAMTEAGRRDALAQAIAHVVIHEWIHIATQSSAHGSRGVTQAYLSVAELIAAPKSNSLSISKR